MERGALMRPVRLAGVTNGVLVLAFLLSRPVGAAAQTAANPPTAAEARQLYREGRYAQLVARIPSSAENPPELDLYRGMALARLSRWTEARTALEAGLAKSPDDERLLVELANVESKTKHYGAARAHLRRALALKPGDRVARDRLASLYLLTDNLDAALENWNRIGKPHITAIEMEPQPRLRPSILQSAFAFSPFSTLRLDQLRTTEARLGNLHLFPDFHFDLLPDKGGTYSVDFVSVERNGFGSSKLEALASLFRDLPWAIDPEFYNVHGTGLNLLSYFRWDRNRRRVSASASMPLEGNAARRVGLFLDARNENWNLTRTFSGASRPLSTLNLERFEFGPELWRVESGRWSWQAHLVYAYREFRHVENVSPRYDYFFADGNSLEYRMRTSYRLLDDPGRRLTLDSSVRSAVGRNFAPGLGAFGSVEGSLELRWFPKTSGEDYQTTVQWRAGRLFGRATLDQLYELGVERDNNLQVRGISGTVDGVKGNAPLGREFVLWNWETDKTVFNSPIFTVQVGPFADIGAVSDPSGVFGSRTWLWDPGVQFRFRILGDIVILVSYGRDLHSGSSALYETATR